MKIYIFGIFIYITISMQQMNLINAEQPHQGSKASQAHVYSQLPDDDTQGYITASSPN